AGKAVILIANHHLVMADLALKASLAGRETPVANAPAGDRFDGVLPPYSRLILDEAHPVEDVAASYFGAEASRSGVLRLLHRLSRILQELAGANADLRTEYLEAADRIEKRALPHAQMLAEVAVQAFAELGAWARAQPREGNSSDADSQSVRVRIHDEPDPAFR